MLLTHTTRPWISWHHSLSVGGKRNPLVFGGQQQFRTTSEGKSTWIASSTWHPRASLLLLLVTLKIYNTCASVTTALSANESKRAETMGPVWECLALHWWWSFKTITRKRGVLSRVIASIFKKSLNWWHQKIRRPQIVFQVYYRLRPRIVLSWNLLSK